MFKKNNLAQNVVTIILSTKGLGQLGLCQGIMTIMTSCLDIIIE